MITSNNTMEGALLTNSQEEQLLTEIGSNLDFNGMEFSISDLDLPNSQKYTNGQNFVAVDDKMALHESLALQSGEMQQQQLVHQELLAQNQQLQQPVFLQQDQQEQLQQQQMQFYQQIPPAQTPILSKEEFPGPFNFKLILNPEGGKHWVLSEKLSKVFIHMEEVLPLQFKWTPPEDGLWLRATLVYKSDQYRSEPVKRCHNHMAPNNNSNRDFDIQNRKHVIRCLHSTSSYEERPNGHLSVLIPLGTPAPGMTNVPVDYKFFCKNSCTHGMNRRATEIIFTLENDQSAILGRTKLEVRICSCPKRDKDKEELDFDPRGQIVSKKRKPTAQHVNLDAIPPPKKKAVDNDNRLYSIKLNIVGRDNVLQVMKYAADVMAGNAIRNNNLELYKPHIERIENEIQHLN